jgi:hypothetical protein
MKKATFLKEETLVQLPLNYRFMTPQPVTAVRELRSNLRLGESRQHQSGQYWSQGGHKPISNLDELKPDSVFSDN